MERTASPFRVSSTGPAGYLNISRVARTKPGHSRRLLRRQPIPETARTAISLTTTGHTPLGPTTGHTTACRTTTDHTITARIIIRGTAPIIKDRTTKDQSIKGLTTLHHGVAP